MKSLSRVRLFATLWTVAHQAPPSLGFSRQEYWSGLPFPSPWDLPDPGIEPRSPALQADTLTSEPPGKQQQIRTYTERAAGGCQGFCRGLRGKVAQVAKNPPANAGDVRDKSLIPGLGRSPGEGNGNPLQYSCLGNPRDGGAWWATVHGVSKELDMT